MPYGGFRWVDPDGALAELSAMTETSDVGRVFEVDIAYPEHLHDAHNDLPFLPENMVPPGSKVRKLVASLHTKKRYVIHYLTLKQAIANGLRVEKVQKIIIFTPILQYYIIFV